MAFQATTSPIYVGNVGSIRNPLTRKLFTILDCSLTDLLNYDLVCCFNIFNLCYLSFFYLNGPGPFSLVETKKAVAVFGIQRQV
jgi:hypothetical protein